MDFDLDRCALLCRRAGFRTDPDDWPVEELLYQTMVIQAVDTEEQLKRVIMMQKGVVDLVQGFLTVLMPKGATEEAKAALGQQMAPVLESMLQTVRRPLE